MNLILWQAIFLLSGLALLPFAPFLYLQGKRTRRRVGVLPGASGDIRGRTDGEGVAAKLLVIGESTVEGLGARTHETALAGQFARRLAAHLDRPVEWTAIGKSGVTARQTIDLLVPRIPEGDLDYLLVGLGGNDVLKLSSPRKWRHDMCELLGILRQMNPNAVIFLANCPVIRISPALPQPIKFFLWQLSKIHDANIREFSKPMENVFYYHQPREVPNGFFADGIHPSEKGYADWSEAMMQFFIKHYKW